MLKYVRIVMHLCKLAHLYRPLKTFVLFGECFGFMTSSFSKVEFHEFFAAHFSQSWTAIFLCSASKSFEAL